MSSRVRSLLVVGGLVMVGCGDPQMMPVAPPGVELPRPIPISAGGGAEAIGEGGRAAATPPVTVSTVVNEPTPVDEVRKTNSGLSYATLKEGTGPACKPGQTVKINYLGQLANGEKFDASADHGGPTEKKIGVGGFIKGFDEGVSGMRVGEKRRLMIPALLGYGANGHPPQIPVNADLIFEVELLDAH